MVESLSPKGWVPITPQDESLYASYLAHSDNLFSYEHNWAFITQEVRVGGFKYEERGMLLTAVVKATDSPFIFILPPYGDIQHFATRILLPAAELARASGRRVVLRKLSADLCKQVLRTGKFRVLPAQAFTHPRDVPEDQFPQVVLDGPATLAMQGSKYRHMRNDLKYFVRQCRPQVTDLDQANCAEVTRLIHDWCRNYNRRHGPVGGEGAEKMVEPTAYTVLAERFASAIDNLKYFAKLVWVNGQLGAFTLAGRSGPQCAAQYTNLSLLRVRGCSEFVICELLRALSQAGIRYLNLGGAETEGQFLFKSKFNVYLIKESFEVEYTP